MDVLQKEIDEVYATQLIADEILDNGVVEQHQRFIHSLMRFMVDVLLFQIFRIGKVTLSFILGRIF